MRSISDSSTITDDTTVPTISRRISCPPVEPEVYYQLDTNMEGCNYHFSDGDPAGIMRKVQCYLKNAGDVVTLSSSIPKLPEKTYSYRDTNLFRGRRVSFPRVSDPTYEYVLTVTDTGEMLICRELYSLLNAACVRLWDGLNCMIEKQYAHGYPKEEYVNVCVVWGVEGHSLGIDDRRVAGPKPWGGGKVVHEFTVPLDKIVEALRGKVVRA